MVIYSFIHSTHDFWKWKWQSVRRVWLFATPWTARLLCPWNSPGKNTGVGSHSLLQGIFPNQGSTWSPAFQENSLLSEPSGNDYWAHIIFLKTLIPKYLKAQEWTRWSEIPVHSKAFGFWVKNWWISQLICSTHLTSWKRKQSMEFSRTEHRSG